MNKLNQKYLAWSKLFSSLLICAAFAPSTLFAHHSDAGIDLDAVVRVEGVVTEFVFRNPHVYLLVEAPDSSGELAEWKFQSGSTMGLSRGGWNKDTFQPGDKVVVRGHPEENGKPWGLLLSVERDGQPVERSGSVATETVRANSLAGTWRGDRTTIGDFTAFFDRLVTNEKGQAAREAFDPLSPENPISTCIGRPTPSTLASAGGYLSEIEFVDDTIVFRNEIFGAEKIVYMDGRGHPDPEDGERDLYGHSIGWWEGDTLVVDAVNFADHRSPYQNGIPSGAQKHVIEKYTLINDGYRIRVELFMEDPEFLAEPLVDTMEWIYSPDFQMSDWECDQFSTSVFLEIGQ